MRESIESLNAIFTQGELLYDQFIVQRSFTTDTNERKVALLCTVCGNSHVYKEAYTVEKKPSCKHCSKLTYESIVAAAEAIDHRVCRGCKVLLPKENFRARVGCRNYINPYCRKCEVARFKYPENLLDPSTGLKRCAMCKILLPVGRFSRHPHNPDGLKSWCGRCNSARAVANKIASGAPTTAEKKQRRVEEREAILLGREKARMELERIRMVASVQFRKDREKFYKDPRNRKQQFLFDFWKKGYYN